MARPNLSVTVKPHDAAAIPDAFIPGIAILKGGIAARRLLARGEEQLRGKHRLELGKLLCKRGTIEHNGGDLHTARAALCALNPWHLRCLRSEHPDLIRARGEGAADGTLTVDDGTWVFFGAFASVDIPVFP